MVPGRSYSKRKHFVSNAPRTRGLIFVGLASPFSQGGPPGALPSVWRVSLAEDEQQAAQQSLSRVPGAQAAGQLTQQGQEVLADQAGGGQQQAGQQRSKQQREQRCGHGWVSDSKTIQNLGLPLPLPLHLAR